MEETNQNVTITPIRRLEVEPFLYRLLIYGNNQNRWTTPGIYSTPEKVVASFTPPLRPEYQTRIVETLKKGNEVKFSLKDAAGPM